MVLKVQKRLWKVRGGWTEINRDLEREETLGAQVNFNYYFLF